MIENSWAFVESKGDYLFIGEVINEELIYFNIFNKSEHSIVGNIYRGRIVNKIKALNAVFVDIGLEKNGFLQLDNIMFTNFKESDEIIVQVTSAIEDEKGPKLTHRYELKSENFVLTPFNNSLLFSKKIRNKEFCVKLKEEIKKILPGNIGLVVRTNAQNLNNNEILEEIDSLLEDYSYLEREKNFSPTPKLLKEYNYLKEYLLFKNSKKIITNSSYYYSLLKNNNPHQDLVLEEDFEINSKVVFSQIKNIFKRKIKLENGIELVFDETEAFHVIDINSHGFLRKGSQLDIKDVNSKAVKEIIKQIHFRNLYGIILIDFINYKDKSGQEEIIKAFRELSKLYKNPVNIIGFTKLGILELTRNKKVNNLISKNLSINIF